MLVACITLFNLPNERQKQEGDVKTLKELQTGTAKGEGDVNPWGM